MAQHYQRRRIHHMEEEAERRHAITFPATMEPIEAQVAHLHQELRNAADGGNTGNQANMALRDAQLK